MQLTAILAATMNAIQAETSQGKPAYVTQEQGMQLAQAGFITVNPGATDPNNPAAMSAIVSETGQAALTQFNESQAPVAETPVATGPIVEPQQTQPEPQVQQPVVEQPQAAVTQPEQPVPVQTTEPADGMTQGMVPGTVAQPAATQPATTAPAASGTQNSIQASQSTRTEFAVLSSVPKPPRPASAQGSGGGGGRKTKYPYDKLEVGQCFFVGDSDYPGGDAHKAIGSSVAAANRRHRIPKVIGYDNTNQPQYQVKVDGKGQPVKDKDGSSKFVTINTKRFRSYKTDANHPNGAGALVYREPLKETDVQAAPTTTAASPQPVAG